MVRVLGGPEEEELTTPHQTMDIQGAKASGHRWQRVPTREMDPQPLFCRSQEDEDLV